MKATILDKEEIIPLHGLNKTLNQKKRIEEEAKMTKEFEKADREAAKDKIKEELKNLKNVR